MESGHNYVFTFDSPAYAEGYDRIFRKKVKNGKSASEHEIGGRRSISETDQQIAPKRSAKPQSTRRIYRKKKVREA